LTIEILHFCAVFSAQNLMKTEKNILHVHLLTFNVKSITLAVDTAKIGRPLFKNLNNGFYLRKILFLYTFCN